METVYIYPLPTLRPSLRRRLYEAQREAARVWTRCRDLHLAARQRHARWPDRDELQQTTKGQFALHSQTVQMICHQFLANVDTARELRQTVMLASLPQECLMVRYPSAQARGLSRLISLRA